MPPTTMIDTTVRGTFTYVDEADDIDMASAYQSPLQRPSDLRQGYQTSVQATAVV